MRSLVDAIVVLIFLFNLGFAARASRESGSVLVFAVFLSTISFAGLAFLIDPVRGFIKQAVLIKEVDVNAITDVPLYFNAVGAAGILLCSKRWSRKILAVGSALLTAACWALVSISLI